MSSGSKGDDTPDTTAGGRKCVAWLRDIQRPVCLESTIGGTTILRAMRLLKSAQGCVTSAGMSPWQQCRRAQSRGEEKWREHGQRVDKERGVRTKMSTK